MNTTGLNVVRIEDEKLLAFEDQLGWEKALKMAEEYKPKAFASVFNLLSRSNPDDIEIVYQERRYQAFWHIAGFSSFEFIRSKSYSINLEKNVQEVTLLNQNFKVKDDAKIVLDGKEKCIEDYREELVIDANYDREGNFTEYLKYPYFQINSTDDLMKENTQIMNLKTNSGNLVRRMMLKLVKPIEAEKMLKEEIQINELTLYFYSVYVFEFLHKLKNKKILISYDGVTKKLNAKALKISDSLKKSFSANDLFEFSKEIAENLVPGGGLAIMVGQKVIELTKKK